MDELLFLIYSTLIISFNQYVIYHVLQIGLNSAFVGCFVYVIFGTIKEVSIGPTSLMAFLTAEYTRNLSTDFVVALCFFVGCCELLMGIFKLGKFKI